MKNNKLLHGITLETILTRLVKFYGWQKLGNHIDINCFNSDPSIKSSLKFLRKHQWARDKVENFYCNYGNPPWFNEDFNDNQLDQD